MHCLSLRVLTTTTSPFTSSLSHTLAFCITASPSTTTRSSRLPSALSFSLTRSFSTISHKSAIDISKQTTETVSSSYSVNINKVAVPALTSDPFLHSKMSDSLSLYPNPKVKTPIDLKLLLATIYSLAQEAGKSIRGVFDSGDIQAVEKETNEDLIRSYREQGQRHHAEAHGPVISESGAPSSTTTSVSFGHILDPQTLADLESQRILIGNLSRLYGKHLNIIGEEGEVEGSTGEGAYRRDPSYEFLQNFMSAMPDFPAEYSALNPDDLIVWVDPLDGTMEFTLGYVHYVTVLIGISYKGAPIAGVIHVPFIGGPYKIKEDPLNPISTQRVLQQAHKNTASQVVGKTIWSAVGVGCFGLDRIPEDQISPSRRFVTTTRSHFSSTLKNLLDRMGPERIIRCGGAGSKGVLVLEGDADAYVYPQKGTKRWDTCALDACTKSLGGRFTDAYGKEISYDGSEKNNLRGLLATLRNHELYVLPEDVPEDTPASKSSL